MNFPSFRRTLLGIPLIIGLMAMALSCGASEEPPAASAPSGSMDQERSVAAAIEGSNAATSGDFGVPGQAGSDRLQVSSVEATPAAMPASVQNQAPTPPPPLPPLSQAAAGEPQGRLESQQAQSDRQLIVEAWIRLEVGEIDATVRQVEALVDQRDGWVESADIVGEAGYRQASLRVRVPADRLDNAMAALRGMGRVTDEGASSTDVTEQLIDNAARLTAWHAQEKRLVTLLENAPTVEDIIQIEQRIAQVRSDIERVEATQRNLTNRVATSLITVHLSLPARFAAQPPRGVLTLTVSDPAATADAITTMVESRNGYIGEKREYDESGGQTVTMVAFVRPTDLSKLIDDAAALGEPVERQLDSVGPAPASEIANAPLTLTIYSNIDLGGSQTLLASGPLAVAEQVRAHAESLGGFVDRWEESRQGDDHESVSMELVVKSSDLRGIMDFGAGLGEVVHWKYNAAQPNPAADAPNARLSVSVSTEESYTEVWIIVAMIAAIVVALVGGIAVALLLSLRRRRNRRRASQAVATLEPDAAG